MVASIYKPAKTAMQSGNACTKSWVLDFEPEAPREIDPLMGWTSSNDMKSQIQMKFPSKDEAIAYAKRNGLAYRVVEPHERKKTLKSYAENFRYGRIDSWTH